MALQKTYHIIGAGISGLIIANQLIAKDIKVKIYEASPIAGGRCRSFNNKFLDCYINNGNHLVLGANKNFLEILKIFNLRGNFTITSGLFEVYDNFTNKKISKNFVILKIINFIFQVLQNKISNDKFYKLISESITNTNVNILDFTILRNVILQILKSGISGFQFIHPKNNWQADFINPLVKNFLEKSGEISFSKSVSKIDFENNIATKIIFSDGEILDCNNDVIISTIPSYSLSKITSLNINLEYNPIINIHIKTKNILPNKIIAVYSDFADWLFCHNNIISITKSAPSEISNEIYNDKNFSNILSDFLKKIISEDIEIENFLILNEKRATINCEKANLDIRPKDFTTNYKNFYICGDFIENNLPSTIEGTIKNSLELVNILQI